MLSKNQELAICYFKNNYNLFISGPGGSGKSFLIKHLNLIAKNKRQNVQVCALTGCACILLHCQAKTIHSWAGIGLGNLSTEQLIQNIKSNKFILKRWKKIDCLIIDEVSMMSKKLFEDLDKIAKIVRENEKPFGGIQIVFVGDFYQLAPVGNKEIEDTKKYCFESDLWNATFQKTIILEKIYRQEDYNFLEILNNIRIGKLTRENMNILKKCLTKTTENLLIKPIKLYPVKRKVNKINLEELSKLDTEKKIFDCEIENFNNINNLKIDGINIEKEINYLKKNSMFEETLELKIGSQVMCIINLDIKNGIINGSTGIITDFVGDNPKVRFYNNKEIIIEKHNFEHEKYPQIKIKQFPLILAWALTIHKSQGSTLDIAEIDVGSSIFTPGQTYVALSRVKNLDGLFLKSFNENKIKSCPKVINFYEKHIKGFSLS